MKCKYCQAELEDGMNVCPVCGKEQEEISAQEVAAETAAQEIVEDVTAAEEVKEPATEIKEGIKATPGKIALAALLFGFFRALGNVYTGFDFLAQLQLPSVVYNMLPYIVSLIVLAFTSKKSRAPKAEGIPYDKSTR
jgi:hypothetical protein